VLGTHWTTPLSCDPPNNWADTSPCCTLGAPPGDGLGKELLSTGCDSRIRELSVFRLNRDQTAVAALCDEGMLPSLLEAQSPAAPLPGGAEAAAVPAINPPAGVRVAGILMIPVVGGKYKVWTKRLGVRQDEGIAAAWRGPR
jgi:hypothetical protein